MATEILEPTTSAGYSQAFEVPASGAALVTATSLDGYLIGYQQFPVFTTVSLEDAGVLTRALDDCENLASLRTSQPSVTITVPGIYKVHKHATPGQAVGFAVSIGTHGGDSLTDQMRAMFDSTSVWAEMWDFTDNTKCLDGDMVTTAGRPVPGYGEVLGVLGSRYPAVLENLGFPAIASIGTEPGVSASETGRGADYVTITVDGAGAVEVLFEPLGEDNVIIDEGEITCPEMTSAEVRDSEQVVTLVEVGSGLGGYVQYLTSNYYLHVNLSVPSAGEYTITRTRGAMRCPGTHLSAAGYAFIRDIADSGIYCCGGYGTWPFYTIGTGAVASDGLLYGSFSGWDGTYGYAVASPRPWPETSPSFGLQYSTDYSGGGSTGSAEGNPERQGTNYVEGPGFAVANSNIAAPLEELYINGSLVDSNTGDKGTGKFDGGQLTVLGIPEDTSISIGIRVFCMAYDGPSLDPQAISLASSWVSEYNFV